MIMARIAGLLIVLIAAGCAGIERSPSRQPETGVTQDKCPAAEPPVAKTPSASPACPESVGEKETPDSKSIKEESATPKTEPSVTTASPLVKAPPKAAISPPPAERNQKTESAAPAPAAKEAPPPGAGKGVAKTESPAARVPAGRPAEPTRAEADQKKEAAASAKQEPPLDLKALEQRLKDTNAIGTFTKLTLKNQVDDLLDQFRAYYQGRAKTTLAQLRKPYEQLLLKVQSLLIEGDPSLANAIMVSREAIWNILSDPAKFAKL